MKMKVCGKVLLLFAVFFLLGGGKSVYAAEPSGNDVIADGVMIDAIDVGGMTADEARSAVEEYFTRYESGILSLSFNGTVTEVSFSQLGITWDNPEVVEEAASCGKAGNVLQLYKELTQLRNENRTYEIEYSLDEKLLEEYLTAQAQALQTDAVDAEITKTSSGFTVTQSATGITVDVEATAEQVQELVQTSWSGGKLSVDATVEVVEPKYKTEELMLIQDCLGDYSTTYAAGNANRSQNLSNATHFINGVVLLPGETMSLYDYCYPTTEANGYKSATAYADGGYVNSVGGGICQVSTTLYNALLEAELNVLTRSPHSLLVSYVQPGFDSAQSETAKDLSFENDTDYPIYVEAWATGGKLYAAIWGKDDRPSNRTVTYYNNILTRQSPGDPIYTEDPTLPAGTQVVDQNAYDYVKVELYKQVSVDGVVTETTRLHTDTYQGSPAKIRVGTAGAEETEEGAEGEGGSSEGEQGGE